MPMERDISRRRRISFSISANLFHWTKVVWTNRYGVHRVQSIAMKYEIRKIVKIHSNNNNGEKNWFFPNKNFERWHFVFVWPYFVLCSDQFSFKVFFVSFWFCFRSFNPGTANNWKYAQRTTKIQTLNLNCWEIVFTE